MSDADFSSDSRARRQARKEARALGLVRFWVGKPCKHGHVTGRYTRDGKCAGCVKIRVLAYTRKLAKDPNLRHDQSKRDTVRSLAEAEGLSTYQGKPCPRGHSGKRFVGNRNCVECNGKRNAITTATQREQRRGWMGKWRKKNPEAAIANVMRRRACRVGAEGFFTPEDIARIRRAQQDRCAYCRAKLHGKGQRDHIIALANGGTNWPSNIQLTCDPCNAKKHARDPIEFAQSLGRLL